MRVIPVSSGYCLGSANFVIKTHCEKIVYMAQTSGTTRHPEYFDTSLLGSPHTLIMTQLQSSIQSKSMEQSLIEFSATIQNTFGLGGCVIIPIHSCGIILDLLEYVDSSLNATQYYVSPVSETVLAYADIVPEWLCKQKQDRVYLPETPFPYSNMIRTAILTQIQNLHTNFAAVAIQKPKTYKFPNSLKEPCVIYVGHPTCRYGDVVHLITMLGSNPRNTIIIIEPDLDPVTTFAPFQPLLCKVLHIPLDPRLSAQEAQLLINELRPHHLVIPKCHNAISGATSADAIVSLISHLDVVNVPVSQQPFEPAFISKELAQKIQPQTVGLGTEMAITMNAQLSSWDYSLTLQPLSQPVLFNTNT